MTGPTIIHHVPGADRFAFPREHETRSYWTSWAEDMRASGQHARTVVHVIHVPARRLDTPPRLADTPPRLADVPAALAEWLDTWPADLRDTWRASPVRTLAADEDAAPWELPFIRASRFPRGYKVSESAAPAPEVVATLDVLPDAMGSANEVADAVQRWMMPTLDPDAPTAVRVVGRTLLYHVAVTRPAGARWWDVRDVTARDAAVPLFVRDALRAALAMPWSEHTRGEWHGHPVVPLGLVPIGLRAREVVLTARHLAESVLGHLIREDGADPVIIRGVELRPNGAVALFAPEFTSMFVGFQDTCVHSGARLPGGLVTVPAHGDRGAAVHPALRGHRLVTCDACGERGVAAGRGGLHPGDCFDVDGSVELGAFYESARDGFFVCRDCLQDRECVSCGCIAYTDDQGHCSDCAEPAAGDEDEEDGFRGVGGYHAHRPVPRVSVLDTPRTSRALFGMELEVAAPRHRDASDDVVDLHRAVPGWRDVFTPTSDSSIGGDGYGVEFVSHPLTWRAWEEVRPVVTAGLAFLRDRGWKSHNADACGLHIHASRAQLVSSEQLAFLAALFNDPADTWRILSRRPVGDFNQWCGRNGHSRDEFRRLVGNGWWRDPHSVTPPIGEPSRYSACNLLPTRTVESRLWRGSLLPGTVFACLDLTRAVLAWSATAHDREAPTAARFLAWMDRKGGATYPEAATYIAARLARGTATTVRRAARREEAMTECA